ncbi:Phage-related protein OS=Lysinibacillus sphaericus OX=1421 GN=LS41612_22390 PE=4 SV=1 [Lysinibacillus sphaericus]
MSSVRDLFVEIGLEIDDGPLDELNELINEIRRSLGNFDSSGLDEIERNAKSAAEELDDLSRDARQASRNVNDLAEDELIATVTTSMMGNSFSLAGMKGIAMGVGVTSALSGILAILAPLIVLVGGLAASFLAAGLGVAALGAVAVPVMTNLFESADQVAQIEEKIANADTAKERIAAQKELAAVYDDMSESQRGALKELQEFKDFFGDFTKQFENPIFDAFAKGLSLVKSILTGLEPTISGVAAVINELLDEMNNSVVGGGLKGFFEWLETHAAGAIYNFAHIFGNLFGGIFKMLASFSPVGSQIEEGLLSMTARFSEWAGSLASSNGFQTFIEYAKTNGPALMGILGDVFGVLGDVIVALAPLGTVVLAGLQLLTGFIASNIAPLFSELSGWITQLAGAFMEYLMPAIQPLIQALLPTLGNFLDNLKLLGQTLVDTFISIFPTLQDIFSTVFPIIVELVTSVYDIISSLINNVVIPLLPILGKVISEVWSVVKPILEPLKNLLSTIGDNIMFLINDVVAPLIPIIGSIFSNMWVILKPILDAIVKAFGKIIDVVSDVIGYVKNLVDAFANVKVPDWMSNIGGKIKSAASTVGGLFNGSHATGLGRVPFDGYAAELHKDEAVLTADQSNTLRDIGVLKGDGSSPQLDLSENDSGSYQTTYSTSSNNSKISAPITIIIQGSENSQETAYSVKDVLEERFGDLLSVMQVSREG